MFCVFETFLDFDLVRPESAVGVFKMLRFLIELFKVDFLLRVCKPLLDAMLALDFAFLSVDFLLCKLFLDFLLTKLDFDLRV